MKLAWILMLITVTVVFSWQWKSVSDLARQWVPIRYVRVKGVFQYLGKEQVRNTLTSIVDTDFFSADMQEIKARVLSLPWVATADVKKVWPDAIDIRIYEQEPYARWGDKSLLNARGDVFSPEKTEEFDELMQVRGPSGYQYQMLDAIQKLSPALAHQSLAMKEFTINERRSWKIVLDNGMQMNLGRRSPFRNFQRFIKTWPLLGREKIELMSIVDLRYPNGFAVTWKPDASINWDSHQDVNNET